MKHRSRDTILGLQETVTDKPVVPVVGVVDFNDILSVTHGRGHIGLPRRTPNCSAVLAVQKYVRDSARQMAEGKSGGVRRGLMALIPVDLKCRPIYGGAGEVAEGCRVRFFVFAVCRPVAQLFHRDRRGRRGGYAIVVRKRHMPGVCDGYVFFNRIYKIYWILRICPR